MDVGRISTRSIQYCLCHFLPCFDQALLYSPSHFSDRIGDLISRRVGKTHIQETSGKQAFVHLWSFTMYNIASV